MAVNRVLIVTPEKFDALLRFVPELNDQIRLLIFDEGHIVDPNHRGVRFELLVQRSLKRFRERGCPFIFISAVLPNAAQFSEWITGTPANLIESKWRPSRLLLGRLNWYGRRVEVVYTHNDQEAFEQRCFIRRFIEVRECRGVAGLGRRRLPFPSSAREALAAAALLFAQDGVTLVFAPQPSQANAAAKDLEDALDCLFHLHANEGAQFSLPIPGRKSPIWARCRRVIEEEMGDKSEFLKYFERGFVVHHSRLPRRVRLAVEDVVREGAVRIIVATTTLAQGVNLPIKTVLVRGLYHSHNEMVSPLTFWNICGRAGRAMKENEGQILFFRDLTAEAKVRNRHERAITLLTTTLQSTIVVSALRLALRMIADRWRSSHASVDIPALCVKLAENDISWAIEADREHLAGWLNILDGHLLALTEEFELSADSPDRLQEILAGSLLFIQLRDTPDRTLTIDAAVRVLHSRVRYVYSQIPDRTTRSRMYKLGMTLSSCRAVDRHRKVLNEVFSSAQDWDSWQDHQRLDLLESLAFFLLEIPDIRPNSPTPPETALILRHWLTGATVVDMVDDSAVRAFSSEPVRLRFLLRTFVVTDCRGD
ncbi:MAG: hypothetical protein L0387_34720 [Acidobacteria bacterium]|nr:hypothetical protein [Acidobacteriota bacterium]MCI0718055.1 hypothetical protein [Acidobacteriota bacterium]